MSDEPKPCPFCGGEVDMKSVVIYSNGEKSPASIKCKKCNYYMAAFENDELIKRWNTHPIEDALLERAERAEAALQNERDLSDEFYLLLVDNPDTKLRADQILVDHCARIGGNK